jgi:hypothetical protein
MIGALGRIFKKVFPKSQVQRAIPWQEIETKQKRF